MLICISSSFFIFHSDGHRDSGYYKRFTVEVRHPINRMSKGREIEADVIPVEFWKNTDKAGLK